MLRSGEGRTRAGPHGGLSALNRILIGLLGIVVILLIEFALSTNRRDILPRIVGAAFA